MVENRFVVACASDKIWNQAELLKFLADHQRQSINLIVNPEAIPLDTLGLYEILDCFEFEQVVIETRNLLEKPHNRYTVRSYWANRFLLETVDVDPALHTWNQRKRFITMYGRPTANRLGIAGHLLKNHATASHIHFSSGTGPDDLEFFELDRLAEYRTESIVDAGFLMQQLPLALGDRSGYVCTGYDFSDSLTEFYKDALIDLVSETHVNGNTFYITEKTLRPMWLKKPFVIFATRDYLDYLHQMGFKTFCEFWPETYDGYEGRDRFRMILELIDSIASKSNNELEFMYHSMKSVLDHNYNLLATQTYQKEIVGI